MICCWLLLQLLLAFSSRLCQACTVQYTRKGMERKLTRGSQRGARSITDPDKDGIPGLREKDYPVRTEVPDLPFSCKGLVDGGLYGDPGPEARCQVFHRCVSNGRAGLSKQSFICPVGALFQQRTLVCDWWYNIDCSVTETLYGKQLERQERGHNPDKTLASSWRPLILWGKEEVPPKLPPVNVVLDSIQVFKTCRPLIHIVLALSTLARSIVCKMLSANTMSSTANSASVSSRWGFLMSSPLSTTLAT